MGKVKTVGFLSELGASLLGESMVIADNAYEIVPGWLGSPIGTFAEHRAEQSGTPRASSQRAPRQRRRVAGLLPRAQPLSERHGRHRHDCILPRSHRLFGGRDAVLPGAGAQRWRRRARAVGAAAARSGRSATRDSRRHGEPSLACVPDRFAAFRAQLLGLDCRGRIPRAARALALVGARRVHRADCAHVFGGRAVRGSEQRGRARRVAYAADVSHRGQRARHRAVPDRRRGRLRLSLARAPLAHQKARGLPWVRACRRSMPWT